MAAGMAYLGLMSVVTEAEGQWRFMGIYAKNREEWTITHLAALR